MSEIIRKINNRERIIMMGDFNSHHTLWNCKLTDSNEEHLLEELDEEELFIVNSDTKSRKEKIRQRDSLDLIFCNDKILDRID